MCFYKFYKLGITHEFVGRRERKLGRHKIAEEDLVCYKVVYRRDDNSWWSLYQDFVYENGKTYTEDCYSLESLDKFNCLEEGVFHSYCSLATAAKASFSSGHKTSIIECIIPKGTPYWESDRGCEYASTSIKIVGKYVGDLLLLSAVTYAMAL